MLPLARAAAVVVWALCTCIRAADECSLPKSLLTVKCGHVVAVDSKTKICPFDPASCSVFVPGDCFDATGANQLAGFTLKCSYASSKCSSANETTFRSVFDTVDAANPSPFDAVPNAKSLTELGAVCFDRRGKDTGSVVLLRAERFCVVDTNCQPQPYTSESKGTAQVLLDLKRAGENSASPAINLNLEALGPDLSVDGFNQTLTNVVTLDLRYNRLTSISDTLFPTKMAFLDVSYNSITSIGNLQRNAPSLQIVLVANNNVNTLDGIKFPSNMTSISFKNNSLQGTVDASALPSSLETIFLTQNQIAQVINAFPPDVSLISLATNKLTAFNMASIGDKVRTLLLEENQIQQIQGTLPAKLTYLDISSNGITALPKFAPQSNYSVLNMSMNAFAWNGASPFPASVAALNLSGTPIQNGELNVSLLPPSLVALDVSNCGIKKVTGDLPPSLRSLRLDKNDLETWVVSSTTYKALVAMPDLVLPATSVFKCPESGTKYIKHFPVCVKDLVQNTTTPDMPSSSSSTNYATYAIVGGGVIVIVLVGGYMWYQRRRDERSSIMSKSDPMDQDMSTFDFVHLGTSKRHDLGDEFNQFRIPMREINIINPLVDQGDYLAGARTMLYKAQFNERLVVLKTLTTEGTEVSDAAAAFVQHIRLRSTLDHPNIVGFLGIVWGNRAKMAVTGYGLMLEFVGHGDLARLLAFDATKDPADRLLQWRPLVPANVSKLALLQQVASAIVYLHSFSPPVTHRNIQAKSVLLTETWDAKLSGFETDPSWIPSDLISPPEVLRGEAWTEKADIYAFGILICELDLGRHPYVNDKNPANNSQIATLVKADLLQPTFSVECPLEVQDIATKCLHFDRKSRPAGVEMEFWLRKLVRTTAV
ncbi:TKL protein kinase [Aphanomyces astaci]|uniref:non-specific serine/threonine protein kinase n=1 Tax=Aphanomyces astaci TaxID=112090 RepID=W4HDG6_APHAT|nr:TKL protein kinase [Aphanomyces astaci]ETV89168.1 TKL protein kinase [Aphanomyces astaci]|eukprot:XP_009821568.1 TKL protein kinase [Aphanomyces astaci]